MLDTVICEVPLPDGFDPSKHWLQTKDFNDPCLATYTITINGRLFLNGSDTLYHGRLNFYTLCRDEDGSDWHEYKAKFTDGQLVEIVKVEQNVAD